MKRTIAASLVGGFVGAMLVLVCMGARIKPPMNPAIAAKVQKEQRIAVIKVEVGKVKNVSTTANSVNVLRDQVAKLAEQMEYVLNEIQ